MASPGIAADSYRVLYFCTTGERCGALPRHCVYRTVAILSYEKLSIASQIVYTPKLGVLAANDAKRIECTSVRRNEGFIPMLSPGS